MDDTKRFKSSRRSSDCHDLTPSSSSISANHQPTTTDETFQKDLPHPWIMMKSKTRIGSYYYFNKETKESRWSPPGTTERGRNPSSSGNSERRRRRSSTYSRNLQRRSSSEGETSEMVAGSIDLPEMSAESDKSESSAAASLASPTTSFSLSTTTGRSTAAADGDSGLGNCRKRRLESAVEYKHKKLDYALRPTTSPLAQGPHVDDASTSRIVPDFSFKFAVESQQQLPTVSLQPMVDDATPMEICTDRPDPLESEKPLQVNVSIARSCDEPMEIDEIVEEMAGIRRSAESNRIPVSFINESVGQIWELEQLLQDDSSDGVMILVLDTNVLISDLDFLNHLHVFCANATWRIFRIVVPYVVLQELDYLKERKGGPESSTNEISGETLARKARKAISWINCQLSCEHSILVLQPSISDQTEISGLAIECNDDRVLSCTMQVLQHLESRNSNVLLILCTNDKNLLNKARANRLHAANVEDVRYLLRDVQCSDPKTSSDKIQITNEEFQSLCDSTTAALSEVVLTEMKEVYGDLWTEVLKIQPPYRSLCDVLMVFKLHWVAVFRFIMRDSALERITSLIEVFKVTGSVAQDQTDYAVKLSQLLLLLSMFRQKFRYNAMTQLARDNLRSILERS